jgi:transcriptional regulator with XRE-family HTH domain
MERDVDVDLAGLGRFVREQRKALGLTQRDLAARLSWSQERVSVLENGKYGLPSVVMLARLASHLDVTLINIIQALGVVQTAPEVTGRDRPGAGVSVQESLPPPPTGVGSELRARLRVDSGRPVVVAHGGRIDNIYTTLNASWHVLSWTR